MVVIAVLGAGEMAMVVRGAEAVVIYFERITDLKETEEV